MIVKKSQIRPRQVKITLNNAEILALPTASQGPNNGLVLVQASEANEYYFPLWANLVFHNTKDVTGIDDPSTAQIETNGGGLVLSILREETANSENDLTALLAGGAGDAMATISIFQAINVTDTCTAPNNNANAPPFATSLILFSSNALDYTGGDPANTLDIYLSYLIVNG